MSDSESDTVSSSSESSFSDSDSSQEEHYCLRYCYTKCRNRSRKHDRDNSHKYKLGDVIDKGDYVLGTEICARLLEDEKESKNKKLQQVIDYYYVKSLYHSNGDKIGGGTNEALIRRHCQNHLKIKKYRRSHRAFIHFVLAQHGIEQGPRSYGTAQDHFVQALKLRPREWSYNKKFAIFLCEKQGLFEESLKYWKEGRVTTEKLLEMPLAECDELELEFYGKTLFNINNLVESSKIFEKLASKSKNNDDHAYSSKCGEYGKAAKFASECAEMVKKFVCGYSHNSDKAFDIWWRKTDENNEKMDIARLFYFMASCDIDFDIFMQYIAKQKQRNNEKYISKTKEINSFFEKIIKLVRSMNNENILAFDMKKHEANHRKRMENENENENQVNNDWNKNNVNNSDNYNISNTVWKQDCETLSKIEATMVDRNQFLSNFIKLTNLENEMIDKWKDYMAKLSQLKQSTQANMETAQKEFQDFEKALQERNIDFKKLIENFDKAKQDLKANFKIIKETPHMIELANKKYQESKKNFEISSQALKSLKCQLNEYESRLMQNGNQDKTIEQRISKIMEKYENEWNESEKEWYNWDNKQMTNWFKYKLNNLGKNNDTIKNEMNKINFDVIYNNLQRIQYNTKYLSTLEPNELIKFGFENETIREILYESIYNLCEKYRKPRPKPKTLIELNLPHIDLGNNKNNNNCNEEKEDDDIDLIMQAMSTPKGDSSKTKLIAAQDDDQPPKKKQKMCQ